jgi:RND family efflux transporter MFP subunit
MLPPPDREPALNNESTHSRKPPSARRQTAAVAPPSRHDAALARVTPRFRGWPGVALAGLLALAATSGCDARGASGDDADATDAPVEAPAVPVEVTAAALDTMHEAVSASTVLRGARERTVVAETAGTLRDLAVDVGDAVQEGQLVARIVNEDLRLSMDEAQALVDRRAHEVERLRPLFEQGYLARQTFDEASFMLDTARSQLLRLQRQGGAQAVRAPFNGIVSERRVEAGSVVAPNQPLLVLTDSDALEARVPIPERALRVLREGLAAEIAIDAFGGATVSGRVSRVDPVVNPQSGTVEVRVAVDSRELELEGRTVSLRPGMFVSVRIITTTHADVVVVPKRAVLREGARAYVFVVVDAGPGAAAADEERAGAVAAEGSGAATTPAGVPVRRVEVATGVEDRDRVEITHGVAVGDRIVVVGQASLNVDSRVVVTANGD